MGLDTLADEVLLGKARSGCEQSFSALYQRHQPRIYRYALQMCGSKTAAEEVTQEVFIALAGELDRYDASRGPLLPYMMGVARNRTYHWLRREQPYLAFDVPDGDGAPADFPAAGNLLAELTHKEAIESLRRAIAALPPAYREVLVLCDLEEMDYAQAAQALGCAIGTVRSRLHRARALLTGKWQGERRPAAAAIPSVKGTR